MVFFETNRRDCNEYDVEEQPNLFQAALESSYQAEIIGLHNQYNVAILYLNNRYARSFNQLNAIEVQEQLLDMSFEILRVVNNDILEPFVMRYIR